MTTGKTIALTRWTFVSKVMSLLSNMLSAAAAAKSLQSCSTLCNPMDFFAARQAPLSMDMSVGPKRRLSADESMLLNCGVGENSSESLGQQGDQTSQS